jgi:hypothetical protein
MQTGLDKQRKDGADARGLSERRQDALTSGAAARSERCGRPSIRKPGQRIHRPAGHE